VVPHDHDGGFRLTLPLQRLLAVIAVVQAATFGDPAARAAEQLASFTIAGDAVPAPLTATPGDPARGRAILVDRRIGLCLLCHSGPFPEQRLQGDLGPDLAGVGSRLSRGQLRLRLIDAGRLNANTIMPPYYRTEGLTLVASAYAGKPILTAQQIEDVVVFLATLQEGRR
jgi:L-cysteine S-thiosulfotransferase